ncbi:hypothetical protein AgCh_034512 [Apium graveolens]
MRLLGRKYLCPSLSLLATTRHQHLAVVAWCVQVLERMTIIADIMMLKNKRRQQQRNFFKKLDMVLAVC